MGEASKCIELRRLFRMECDERLKCILRILDNRQGRLMERDYDMLYQELDSLYGGAKAICFSELEQFFFTLASYARFLKRCSPDQVSRQDIALIPQGIALLKFLNNDSDCCAIEDPERLMLFSGQLHDRMRRTIEETSVVSG